MKALCIQGNNIVLKTVPLPQKKSDRQILVRVHSMGLNRADLLQAEGLYPASDGGSGILGMELAGECESTGEAVCALVPSGAFAEYVYVYPEEILPLPKNIELTRAAALPECLLTCWLNIFKLGKLKRGQSILVHGGSSGIGSFAIQLAKAFDCTVYTTVGNEIKKDFCLSLGADKVFNYQTENYAEAIKSAGGVNLVLDILGGSHLNNNLKCLTMHGRLALIAVMSGSKAEINSASILMKNLTIVGSTLRSKSLRDKKALIKQATHNVYPLLETGAIRPKIDLIFDIGDFQLAFSRLKERLNLGKILIKF